MGMFDSLYDPHGNEWQTKAYHRLLDRYTIGDQMPARDDGSKAYQVKVLGDVESFATIRDDHLEQVPVDRDLTLPLVDYYGGPAL